MHYINIYTHTSIHILRKYHSVTTSNSFTLYTPFFTYVYTYIHTCIQTSIKTQCVCVVFSVFESYVNGII